MNPNEDYCEVEHDGKVLILAKALLDVAPGNILSVKKGSEYEGCEYLPLFDFAKTDKKAFYITLDDYVTLDAGSGIVHIAPAFGEDDAKVGRKYGLPFVQMVDTQGKFTDEAVRYDGVFAKDADKMIISDLDAGGKLFKSLEHTHSYPFCWRCDTALLYYARASWFIRMTAVKDKLIENNARINWIPPSIRDGRMGNFLENVIDWGLSRERYWGTPLPIWECECGHFECVGSKEELKKLSGIEEDVELHRPYIDKVTIPCPKCGGTMKRVSEVIDCWYDSGSMPFAQWHYPFEN